MVYYYVHKSPPFYIHGSVHHELNLITVQQDATYSVYYITLHQYNGTLITEQNRGEQNPLFQLDIDTGLMSQLFHNK